MREVVARIFDVSPVGVVAEEDTDFFNYCREAPDDPAQVARTRDLYERADLHVMGRNLYQGAASFFPTAVDHPYADLMNAARKLVFSRTLQDASWNNSSIVRGDLTKELERLKQGGTGDIIAHGRFGFWLSLIRLDLIDRYRLSVFSYLPSQGRRLSTTSRNHVSSSLSPAPPSRTDASNSNTDGPAEENLEDHRRQRRRGLGLARHVLWAAFTRLSAGAPDRNHDQRDRGGCEQHGEHECADAYPQQPGHGGAGIGTERDAA
jgi:dihydrofolate reductase